MGQKSITVKELISQLAEANPEAQVVVLVQPGKFYAIKRVEQDTDFVDLYLI